MMKLVVCFDELENFGSMDFSVSQEFREKMLDQFLQDQFPAWSPEIAFGKRDWDFENNEVHIEMSVI